MATVAAVLLKDPSMSRARNRERRFRPPTLLSRFCAAWIILLALSPFRAPFSICHTNEITGVNPSTQRPMSRGDDFEAWVMQGVDLGVEPTTPLATTIAAMSASTAAGLGDTTDITNFGPIAPAPIPSRSRATPLVLRV